MDSDGGFTQEIHKIGCELTSLLQTRFDAQTSFFVWISKVLDPRYSYLICFPLMYHFNRCSGIKILWTAAIVEWINHVSKWMLFGERTYWWVQEHVDTWNNGSAPVIQQFSNTCETGPGSPSGHVMIMGAVLYLCLHGLLEFQGSRRNPAVCAIGWVIYVTVMLLIATSRVFIAAHFPHQCAAGFIMGMILGYLTNKVNVIALHTKYHLGTFLLMSFTAISSYYGLIALGFDPDWSIPLAQKWCAHPEWVHLNTTPFYMFWRYTGTILGIGLLSLVPEFYHTVNPTSQAVKGLVVIGSLASAFILSGMIPDVSSTTVVYFSAFVVHSIIPVVIIGALPWVSARMSQTSKKDN